MSTLWHILWPGWIGLAQSVVLGAVGMIVLTPFQLWYMRVWSRKHTEKELQAAVPIAVEQATTPLHERIAQLEGESYR